MTDLARALEGLRSVTLSTPARVDALQRILEALPRGVEDFAASAQLSVAVARDGLERTLRTFDAGAMHRFAARAPVAKRVFINLAANVFTAPLRPVVLSALVGVPTLARASQRDRAFIGALEAAFDAGPLAGLLRVVHFDRNDDESHRKAMASADLIEAFGSDATITRLQTLAPKEACFVARGHGYGAFWLDDSNADMDALAQDVVGYDQRGCLSPRVGFVHAHALSGVAKDVLQALETANASLPRHALPADVAAESTRWKDTARALAHVVEGESATVVVDASGTMPMGPTHRHVLLRPCAGASLNSTQLKVLGVEGQAPKVADHVRVCALGEMQSPPPFADADGLPAGYGLVEG
ncbi:MAG: acyl-CoA reductase [Myxococcota bacterium]